MNYAVIGAGFGDEGKGLVTSSLALTVDKPLIVRYNGGHQAGHTVCTGARYHTFSNLGSGTLFDVPTLWSRFCTVDPIALAFEANELFSQGFRPRMYIDLNCPVTTPYDVAANHMDNRMTNHGTVGVGFGQTLQRETDHYHFKVRDLLYPVAGLEKLKALHGYYGSPNVNFGELLETPEEVLKAYLKAMNKIITFASFVDTSADYDLITDTYKNFIFEGAQGLMLDQEIGFFPQVTRSNTGLKNIHVLLRELGTTYRINPIYVTRSYLTRHGKGPLPGEDPTFKSSLKNIENEANKDGGFQGIFRYAPLNPELLKYAIASDLGSSPEYSIDKITLAVTCLDQHTPAVDLVSLKRQVGALDLIPFASPISKRI